MIRLDVQDYCQECLEFTAEVERPIKFVADDKIITQTDTIVSCSKKPLCSGLKRWIESESTRKGEENDV